MSSTLEPRPRRTDAEILERFRAKGPPPGASKLLGFEITGIFQGEKRITGTFLGRPELCNPLGQVQGGILTAMLDELMSVAAIVSAEVPIVVPTLEIKTSFLRPAMPGRLIGEGRVLRMGRNVAFLEGRLSDASGALLATATSTAMIIPRPPRMKDGAPPATG